jgi:hypothetical protein
MWPNIAGQNNGHSWPGELPARKPDLGLHHRAVASPAIAGPWANSAMVSMAPSLPLFRHQRPVDTIGRAGPGRHAALYAGYAKFREAASGGLRAGPGFRRVHGRFKTGRIAAG